jgi:hypothetical protein
MRNEKRRQMPAPQRSGFAVRSNHKTKRSVPHLQNADNAPDRIAIVRARWSAVDPTTVPPPTLLDGWSRFFALEVLLEVLDARRERNLRLDDYDAMLDELRYAERRRRRTA